ncbi:MAG: LysR family transcriptional regulator [Sandaracinaceae bacterium]
MDDTPPIPPGIEQLPKAAVFAAVAREGSFSAAAKVLRMARSTVSQHVASLEGALGVRLIERTTRQMRLTQEGELLFERMTTALGAWEDARSRFAEQQAEPGGLVRVTAPGGLASTLVARAAAVLMERYPQVRFELRVDDETLDLVRDGLDLAVRMAPLEDSTLIAKKLGATPKVLLAHPRLAEALGSDVEAALTSCGYVGHTSIPHSHIALFDPAGEELHVPVTTRAAANAAAQLALVEAGVGVALFPELFARDALESGRVTRVFPHLRGADLPIYAVYPARRLIPRRVSTFIPLLEAELRLT